MDRKLQDATMSCRVPLQFDQFGGPCKYSLILDKAHWIKISSTLNYKPSVMHQQKWTYLIQRAAWPQKKDQQKFWSYYQVRKFLTDASSESTSKWFNAQKVRLECKMELNVQILTAMHCQCLSGYAIKTKHEICALFMNTSDVLITNSGSLTIISNLLPMYLIWQYMP